MPGARSSFVRDASDDALLRLDEGLRSDVWGPHARAWRRWPINPFAASITTLSPREAMAGFELALDELHAPNA
jgi:hypothetical protein